MKTLPLHYLLLTGLLLVLVAAEKHISCKDTTNHVPRDLKHTVSLVNINCLTPSARILTALVMDASVAGAYIFAGFLGQPISARVSVYLRNNITRDTPSRKNLQHTRSRSPIRSRCVHAIRQTEVGFITRSVSKFPGSFIASECPS